MLYQYNHFLSFSQTDSAGIMFYSRAFEIAHLAYEEMVAEKIGWEQIFDNTESAFPLVHSEINYFKPVKAGQRLAIQISLANKGESSFQLKFDAKIQDEVCFSLNTTHVSIDKANFKKKPLPSFVSELLS